MERLHAQFCGRKLREAAVATDVRDGRALHGVRLTGSVYERFANAAWRYITNVGRRVRAS